MRKTVAQGIFLTIAVICYGIMFAMILPDEPFNFYTFVFGMFGSYFFGAFVSLHAFSEKEDQQ